MKVLVLNGSPRVKSNTMIVTNEFLAGFKEKVPDAEIEVIDLKKVEIRPCLGCFGCWTKTPGKCVINDEMRNVLFPKFLEADVVVWAAPLYFFSIPSKTKAFMDRTLPFALPYIQDGGTGHPSRYEKMPKTVVISNCGFYDISIFGPMDKAFQYAYGDHETIYRTQGEMLRYDIPTIGNVMEAIRQCGREYATDGKISEDTKAKATAPMADPAAFVKSANAHWDQEIAANKKGGPQEGKSGDMSPAMMVAFFPSLYNKAAYTKDMVCQMDFTDFEETYNFSVTKDALVGVAGPAENPDLTITITFEDWMAIANGKASGQDLVMEGRMKVKGGLDNLVAFTSLIGKMG